MRTRERIRPFVGRVRELEELGSAIAEADAGRGSLLLISGEPGIGKSRLMEELADDVTERGWRVLNGRCWEGGGAPAYWPWVQVVREAGGEFDRLTPPDGESGRVRADRSVMDARLDPDAARFRLFDEVGRFLDDLARERPCLIVLDDLHAADEPSLLLLRFLATTGTTRPVVVVGSYRENEPRVVELADVFGELARLGRRIPLRGLSEDEVVTFVGLMWGDGPPASLADRVYRVTNGNPFFVGEVVRALIAEGWEGLGEPEGILPLPCLRAGPSGLGARPHGARGVWLLLNHACTKTLDGPDLGIRAAELGRNVLRAGGRVWLQQGVAPPRSSFGAEPPEQGRTPAGGGDAEPDRNRMGTGWRLATATRGRAAAGAACWQA